MSSKVYLTCLHCLKEKELPSNDFDADAAISTFATVHGAHANPNEIEVTVHESWWQGIVRETAQVKH